MEVKVCAKCGNCWEGWDEENTMGKESCPECGGTARVPSVHVEHVEDVMSFQESIGGKVKDPNQTQMRTLALLLAQ
jgi:hypothetical protein